MFWHGWRRRIERIVLATVALCAVGCEPQHTPHRYSVLAGKVVACHAETGELSILASQRTAEDSTEQKVYCVVTDDSEVYVNDRFSSIEEIQLGDTVELIGYRDPDPQIDRFVVSFVYSDHALPVPPRPKLPPASAPATQATTAPADDQSAEGPD